MARKDDVLALKIKHPDWSYRMIGVDLGISGQRVHQLLQGASQEVVMDATIASAGQLFYREPIKICRSCSMLAGRRVYDRLCLERDHATVMDYELFERLPEAPVDLPRLMGVHAPHMQTGGLGHGHGRQAEATCPDCGYTRMVRVEERYVTRSRRCKSCAVKGQNRRDSRRIEAGGV